MGKASSEVRDDCQSALQLTEGISNTNGEHDCFALCFNATRLLDYIEHCAVFSTLFRIDIT